MTDWRFLYIDNASIYQPVLEAGLTSAPAEAKGLDKVFRRFGAGHGKGKPKVLDVSCGIGQHSINLAKLGYEVVGYDFSPYFRERLEGWPNRKDSGRTPCDSSRGTPGSYGRLSNQKESRGSTR